MNKRRLLNLRGSIAGLFLILTLILWGKTALSQTLNNIDREILVYIHPSVLKFPTGEKEAMPMDLLTIQSQELRQVFNRFGINTLAKAFPDFNEADTIRVSEVGRLVRVPRFSRIFKMQVSDKSNIDSVIAALSKVPGILFAEKNIDESAKLFYDPTYTNQWHLNNTGQGYGTSDADISAEEAWEIYTGSSSIKIGIFDSGVQLSHPEFSGKISGDDLYFSSSDPHWSHGTHVAGIAAAKADNGYGGKGIDWNAKIVSKQIFDSNGSLYGFAMVAQDIMDAVDDDGVHVLNNSWGTIYNNPILHMVFAYAYNMNCVAVASIGNGKESGNITQYPAGFGYGIIAVGATTNDDNRAVYSQTGNHIDVAAPGGSDDVSEDGIWSTWRNSGYNYAIGTSMAAPQVSGIASLLKGYGNSIGLTLANDDIENIIKLSADDVNSNQYPGWDQELGYGRVNALKALRRLRGPYALTQSYTEGGTDQGASEMYQMRIYNAPYPLEDAIHDVKRHEVRTTINYPETRNVKVWGRGAASIGWKNDGDVNYAYGFCEPVPGTVTSTSATLRTYIYAVYWYDVLDGYYPVNADNVRFEYTIHGIPATIESNTTWEGKFDLDGSVTVNSGVTLTISSGTSMSFADGASLIINGTLIAEGTAEDPIVFTSSSSAPSSGDWYGIRFEDSSVDANCIMEYCEIQYAQYGIYCNRAEPTIQNNSISNSNNGIYLYYSSPDIDTNSITDCNTGIYGTSSSPAITDNLIRGHSSQGVSFSGGSPVFYDNTIDENYYGALFINTSCPEFGPTSGSGEGNNDIVDNTYYGVIGRYFSDIFMGSHDYQSNRIGGYNSIYDNNVADAYAYYLTDIEAEYCYWGSSPSFSCYQYSTINHSNALGSDQADGSSLAKSTTLVKDRWEGFDPNNPDYNNLSDLWLLGEHLFINNQLEEAIDAYQMLVNKFSGDDYANRALVKIKHLYNKTGKDGLTGYLCGLLQNSKIDNNVHQLIYPLLIDAYLSDRDVNSAVDLAKTVMDKYPNSVTEKITLYNMTLAMLNDSKDKEAASKYVGLLKQKYPEDELTYMAREAMGEEVKWSLDKPIPEPEIIDSQLPDKYALYNNYPNPFNSSTTISFDIPEPIKVSFVIYDILGREVWSGGGIEYVAGRHSIIWSGTNNYGSPVATGMYILQMITTKYTDMKKILLIQ